MTQLVVFWFRPSLLDPKVWWYIRLLLYHPSMQYPQPTCNIVPPCLYSVYLWGSVACSLCRAVCMVTLGILQFVPVLLQTLSEDTFSVSSRIHLCLWTVHHLELRCTVHPVRFVLFWSWNEGPCVRVSFLHCPNHSHPLPSSLPLVRPKELMVGASLLHCCSLLSPSPASRLWPWRHWNCCQVSSSCKLIPIIGLWCYICVAIWRTSPKFT